MRMTSKNDLDSLIKDLRQQHRSTQAPAALETLLRAAAERKPAPTRLVSLRPFWAWGLTAATLALVLVGLAEWATHRGMRHGPSYAPLQAAHQPASAPQPALKAATSVPPASLGPTSVLTAQHAHKHRPRAAASTDSQSAWQPEFVALPASEGLPPATAVSLVRMRIQQASLQQYGLEVPAESTSRTLLAEFMVGEDGLPRAVRILQ